MTDTIATLTELVAKHPIISHSAAFYVGMIAMVFIFDFCDRIRERE